LHNTVLLFFSALALVFLSGVFAAVVTLLISDFVRSVSEAPATPLGAGNNSMGKSNCSFSF
jgi:hypothetical protein